MAWDTAFDLPQQSFLSPAELDGLAALFRAIQPSDPARGVPGADEAGAATFVGLLLARDPNGPIRIHADLPKWRQSYSGWLSQFDTIAKARFGKPLASADTAEAGTLIRELEAGTLANFQGNQRAVFSTLWRHCLQGCWSDPRWGGNRERIMWRWLGHLYDPQRVMDEEGS